MWIIYSVLMYVASVVLYLALRKLQKKDVPNVVNNALMFSFGAIAMTLIVIIQRENLVLDFSILLIILVTTFLFSYLGSVFSLEGIKHATNPGLALIIQKSYAIYTAIAAVFLFQSELTTKSIIAIAVVVIFMVIMLWQPSVNSPQKNTAGSNWLIMSFLAFFAFGSLALVSKWLLNIGVSPIVRTFYVQFFVALMFLVSAWWKSRNRKEVKIAFLDKSNYIWFLIIGVCNAIFNLFMQFAFQVAPNVGYVNIINAGSISAITLLSVIVFGDKLTLRKWIGVIGITLGVALLLI